MEYTIEEKDEKVIIESGKDYVWCLYDNFLDEWLVTKRKKDSDLNMYYETKTEAVDEALVQIGLLK